MKVVLPDNSALELPDGATGLDAARAIGPKLAEQAVLVRSNGSVQDLRLPLEDGQPIQILTTRDKDDPDALYVLRHSAAHLLAEAVRRLYPGVKIAIGPPIENGFYYDFEFPEPIREEDLARIEEEVNRELAEGREWARTEVTADEARERFAAEGEPYKVELVDTAEGPITLYTQGDFTDLCRGPHLQNSAPIKAIKLLSPRRRLLARRRAQPAADADLRHRLLLAGGSRRVPRADRGGEEARPPPARHPARPLPPLRRLARLAVLAPEGDGALERARGSPPAREPEARLLRGEDAAALRRRGLQDLGPLRELRREHVLRPRRRADVRAQADELPRPHAPVREQDAELPRAADPLRGVVDAAPQRARGDAARAAPRPPHHPGRRAHLLHRGADPGRDRRDDRVRPRPVRALRRRCRTPSSRPGRRSGSAPTSSGTPPRARSRRRSSGTRSRT